MPQIPAPSATPILTYPLSPQEAPHEFLTSIYSTPYSLPKPTAKTPWSNCVPHSSDVIIPPVYYPKTILSASIATETGEIAIASLSASESFCLTS